MLLIYPPPWPASYYIAQWSKTQAKTIQEQLFDGIRYFDILTTLLVFPTIFLSLQIFFYFLDIRVGYQNKDFYIVHGMIGDSVDVFLDTIMEFCHRHPHEVVIIDFNHFYEMKEEEHDKLCSNMQKKIGNRLWPFSHADHTLNQAFSEVCKEIEGGGANFENRFFFLVFVFKMFY